MNYLKVGDAEIQFCNDFRLFMILGPDNSYLQPDLAINVLFFFQITMVNFSVMLVGLEEQLLGDILNLL